MAIVGPSFSDFVAVGQAVEQFYRPDVIPYDGSLVLADLHASAAMADANERMSAMRFRATFLDGASGDDLTVLVNDRYNIQRQDATTAVAVVQFSRSTTLTAGTIPAGTQVATAFGPDGSRIVFTTDIDTDTAVAIGQAGPFSINVTATVSGTAGNVAAGQITVVVDALFDTFTVTNVGAAAGGNEEESDDSLRARARAFFQTLARGTLAALEFGALTIPSVRIAKASEDALSGIVYLAVSDETGSSNAQMVSDVDGIIDLWRCAGTKVNVVGGVASLVDMAISVVARTGFDVTAIASDLAAAVTAKINRLKAGEPLYIDSITMAVLAQYPDDLHEVVYTAISLAGVPSATPDDVKIIASSTGIVLRAGTITVGAA